MPIVPLPIVIDAGPAVHQNAGLSRYTERLITTILAHHSDQIDLTLFYNAHSGHQPPTHLQNVPTNRLRMGQYPWRIGSLLSSMIGRPLSPKIARSARLYHATEHLLPHVNCPSILTVHDLIFEKYPAHHTRRNHAFLCWSMPRFVSTADAIIAVSQHTKSDLIELYQTPAEKIHVIYEGIDSSFAPAPTAEIQRVRQHYVHSQKPRTTSPQTEMGQNFSGELYANNRPYLLMVGTLEPRKNHATAMRAIARRKAAGHDEQLLIVGGKGWLFDPIQALVDELNITDRVHFTGYVPATDLPALYSGAACVLVPSLYEGFGFSVLEAMACGTPVICSNVSSLPEVAGNAALLLEDPVDEEELASLIGQVLQETGLANQLRKIGIKRADEFSWETCAAETVELYKRVV